MTKILVLESQRFIGNEKDKTKEVFEMKRTTLVYYLQNEPKYDQL